MTVKKQTRKVSYTQKKDLSRKTGQKPNLSVKKQGQGSTRNAKQLSQKKPVKTKLKKQTRKISHVTKQTFLPTVKNGGHPHILRYYGLIGLMGLVILVQVFYSFFIDGRILGEEATITQAKLVSETNEERAKQGMNGLTVNGELESAAEAKARDMLEKDYWSHDAPDGTKPWYWIENAGYKYAEAGENLARGFNTAEGIVAAWLDSPSHRENMLKADYTEVGVAVVNGTMHGKRTTLVVAMYAKPSESVLGSLSATTQAGNVGESEGVWTRMKRGIQSLTPSLLFILAVLGIVTMLSVLAHIYRRKLPAGLKKEWHKHHVIYELAIIAVTAIGAVLSYGGGMI